MFFTKVKDETNQLEILIERYKNKPSPDSLHKLLELFPKVPLFYDSLMPDFGPDNFPYVSLKLRSEHKGQVQTTLKAAAKQCLVEGFGATINKTANNVDWVFSLGDFISLVRRGVLVSNPGDIGFRYTKLREEIKVQVGSPSEDIIPIEVRKHLREYMQTLLKIKDPKFYLMFNPKDIPPWTILFNFSQTSFKNVSEFQTVLGSLSWFFPKTVFIGAWENDTNQFYDI